MEIAFKDDIKRNDEGVEEKSYYNFRRADHENTRKIILFADDTLE